MKREYFKYFSCISYDLKKKKRERDQKNNIETWRIDFALSKWYSIKIP